MNGRSKKLTSMCVIMSIQAPTCLYPNCVYRRQERIFFLILKNVIDLTPSVHQIPVYTPTTVLQSFSRKEFHVHSEEVLSSHDTLNWISTSVTLSRFFTKCHIHHLFFQFVSKRNVLFLHNRTQKHLHEVFWRSELHVRRLQIRIVSQCVVCVHSTTLRSYLLFRVWKGLARTGPDGTSRRINEEFLCLPFLHANREASVILQESCQRSRLKSVSFELFVWGVPVDLRQCVRFHLCGD